MASLPSTEVTRRAWHAAAAALGPDVEAAAALEAVGADARSRGAYAVAASALQRAAQLTDDARLRADRGVAAAAAAFDAGDAGWALRLLDGALSDDVSATTRSRAGELRGAITARSGGLGEACATLIAAARDVADTDPDRALHLVADAIGVAFYLANGDVARESQRLAESLLDRGVDRGAAAIGRLAVGMAQVLDGQDGPFSCARAPGCSTARMQLEQRSLTPPGWHWRRCSFATMARPVGCSVPWRRPGRTRRWARCRICSSTWRATMPPPIDGLRRSRNTPRPRAWRRSWDRARRRRRPLPGWPGSRPVEGRRTRAESTRRAPRPSPSRARS